MWQSRTDKLGLLCIEVQMTYEYEHVRIGYWHRKTKHMKKKPVQRHCTTYIYYEMFWYWTQGSSIWQDMTWCQKHKL